MTEKTPREEFEELGGNILKKFWKKEQNYSDFDISVLMGDLNVMTHHRFNKYEAKIKELEAKLAKAHKIIDGYGYLKIDEQGGIDEYQKLKAEKHALELLCEGKELSKNILRKEIKSLTSQLANARQKNIRLNAELMEAKKAVSNTTNKKLVKENEKLRKAQEKLAIRLFEEIGLDVEEGSFENEKEAIQSWIEWSEKENE